MVEDLPCERALALVHRAWGKRSAEVTPVSLAISMREGDSSATTGYAPVVPGIRLAIHHTKRKKNRRWAHSIPNYIKTGDLPITAYVGVIALDPECSGWLHRDVGAASLARLRRV